VLLIPVNCGNEFNQDICYNNHVHTGGMGSKHHQNDKYPVRFSSLLSNWIDNYHFNEIEQDYNQVYVWLYVYICMHACIDVNKFIYVYTCIYIHINIYMYNVYISICI
jgi:hypothetical protein